MKSEGEVDIRPASAEDAADIHRLIVALAESLDDQDKVTATVDDIRNALSGSDPAMHALITQQDDQILGVAVFFLTFSTWRGTRGVYLQDIYLHPSLRSAGSGRKLLASVVAWAAEQGADHLRLSVDSANREAQKFYENIGMSYRDEEMIYQISGRDFDEFGVLS